MLYFIRFQSKQLGLHVAVQETIFYIMSTNQSHVLVVVGSNPSEAQNFPPYPTTHFDH